MTRPDTAESLTHLSGQNVAETADLITERGKIYLLAVMKIANTMHHIRDMMIGAIVMKRRRISQA
jgi:hypothetical protein